MNRVEKLTKAGRSYSRAWHEFIRVYAKHPAMLYCFFEGQDDSRYYGMRIKSVVFVSENPIQQNFWCEGKENLISLFHLVISDKRYRNAWVAFFIDRDFDNDGELPNDDRLYVTPCYSIENFYISIEAFKQILRDEFMIQEDHSDFPKTIALYLKLLGEFIDAMEEINAWIYLNRVIEKQNAKSSKLNLASVSPNVLFTIRIDKVIKKYKVEDLHNLFPFASLIEQEHLESQVLYFKQFDRSRIFRGKYLIHFLECLLKLLIDDCNTRRNRKHFSERKKVSLKVSANLISELTQYADTPPCLVKFLQKVSNKKPKQTVLDI